MAFKKLSSENLGIFERRVSSVGPHSQRRFGTLEPTGMLVHLRAAIEMSLGELPGDFTDRSTFLSRNIGRPLVFSSWMPWPKGKIKVPDELTPPPGGDCNFEKEKLLAATRRFVEISEREPGRIGLHTMFGPMTLAFWQRAHGKHFEHHLRQFGV